MTEDQSVVGRRRIYYDGSVGEALICTDSDVAEVEEENKEFAESEDYILRLHGFSQDLVYPVTKSQRKASSNAKKTSESNEFDTRPTQSNNCINQSSSPA
ncbi:hypothetical protein Nepgr_027070 [Nepenthes gracilis]|uniref:Uncharacterized protein n=1 Tax=Nepenthes gracilis TaxID=150966 RepID=A0AAD3Y0Y2_NEPGR|nr:hypothetical protein Nepgr_027070 [Nepenthes gracilis]